MTPRRPTRLAPRVLPVAVVCAVSLVAFVVLSIALHGRPGTHFDHTVDARLHAHVSDWIVAKSLHLSDPKLIVVLTAVVVVWAVVQRHWPAVVLAVGVPVASVLVTEHVLKPLVHRTESSFPSGHEAGIAGIVCVAAVVLLASRAHVAVKIVVLLVFAVDIVLAAVGLVAFGFHNATDTIGSVLLCLAVTSGGALVLDGLGALLPRDRGQGQEPPRVHPEVSDAQSGQTTV